MERSVSPLNTVATSPASLALFGWAMDSADSWE